MWTKYYQETNIYMSNDALLLYKLARKYLEQFMMSPFCEWKCHLQNSSKYIRKVMYLVLCKSFYEALFLWFV